MKTYEDTTRYQAPPSEPNAYEEGYQAYYDLNPTPDNYLDLVVSCPNYPQGSFHYGLFYQGVNDAIKNYENILQPTS